ncbi:glycosyltransferase family protein [Bradyrhizobium sp.]|uniref:glycosyltransferase family protein n=1 Tax=Bradyrhizobium sp. TaxID=376 RepID=UPI002D540D0D|nr:glycosyltransferase family protein [Bradyrhizobium sp.]HZR76034.1 glycosyltransferase family protein [Bradyrhizobium sp.]
MRVIATIEARMSATRLPGKVMFPLAGAPMLQRLVERVRRARLVDEVVVASTVSMPDEAIADLCRRIDCRVYRGPVEDITQRLLNAAKGADLIVQLTGDCPLIDPEHVDETVRRITDAKADYASNSLNGCTFPIGFDVRAFTMEALQRSADLSDDPVDRVHGSYFIYRNPQLFRLVGWEPPAELRWPELRLTVDEPADYELVRRVFEHLYPERLDFSARDVVTLLRKTPDWVAINSAVRQKTLAEG